MPSALRAWRSRIGRVLDDPHASPSGYAALKAFMLALIAATVIGAALETLPGLGPRTRLTLAVLELSVAMILTVEYALRLWTAPERDPAGAAEPWRGRLRYVVSGLGLIDLLAILPFYVDLLVPVHPDWLRVLRLTRVLKVARYAPGLGLFAAVLRTEYRALLAMLLVVTVLLTLEAAVIYVLERETQPKVFASIPHSMWWAIVTIATVGYGDMYPVTPLGKLVTGLVMVLGIAVVAVPAGILATGFAAEMRKREFVVNWQTVAKLPLFSGLDATRIAEIVRLLKPQVVPAQFAVVRRDEPADAMFFIMSGQVEVDVHPHPVRLHRGQYFGEIALLRDIVRTATVTAVTECQLLALDVADFRRLLETNPGLKASITRVAEQRIPTTHVAERTDQA
jgi:voltage-gated potassium channel